MRKLVSLTSVLIILGTTVFTGASPSNAIFGLSKCEKVKKQAQSDTAIINSLAKRQAALVKARNAQIAREGYINWLSDINAVTENEVKNTTLATYKKILSSFKTIEKSQQCLLPQKYAEVLSLIEEFENAVRLWSSDRAPYLSNNLIKTGDLTYYLK